jgi:hypothetical protein
MFNDRAGFGAIIGARAYVPAMQFAHELLDGAPVPFSLGTPAASDDDIIDASIDADAGAGTEEVQDWTADSPFGRTLILTPSGDPGAAGGVLDVYGWDYLGQLMIERFTGANGSTAILYGKKAFYRVFKTRVVTATTNAVTYKLGTGRRLGLPYKCDLVFAREAGVLVEVFNRDVTYMRTLAAADAAAGASRFIRSPFPGFVKTLIGTPHGGGAAVDPVVTVELGGTAITGLTVTVDTSNAAGLTVTDTPTTAGYNANNRFVKDGLIEIVSAAAAGAGAIDVGVVLTPTQFTPGDVTDPATNVTGDPRGTYESLMTLDGAGEIIVGILGDPSVNASGNGGLHGVAHFAG